MLSWVAQAVGKVTRWVGTCAGIGRNVATKLLAIHPFMLGINIYCYIMSTWPTISCRASYQSHALNTAMRALQRINFMKQVELLEHLDEQGLRMLLNALPAWVKVRTTGWLA